jgi:hypothetical protein
VEPYSYEKMQKRGKSARFSFLKADGTDKLNCHLTEVYIDLIPNEIELDASSKETLDDQDFPVRYVVTLANDDRIIRCEPYGYLSRVFPVFMGQFGPDYHELVNQSLADMVSKLQEVVDWFFNSRVASVVRTLDNQRVVDPSGVEMATVTSNSRIILMKKSAARQDPRRFVHQLQVTDVTGRHLDDMSTTAQLMPQVTGVSEGAMGIPAQGRRSAYEMRVVTNGSASRMRKVVALVWESVLEPMGNAMLINHRQAIDFDTFRIVIGDDVTPESFQAFKGTPEDLVQNNDLLVFDGTLPSDKLFLSQSLQEIFTVIMSNPQAAVQFNIDPKEIFEEMYRLRGVTKLERFSFKGESLINQIVQQIQLQAQGGQPAPNPNQPPPDNSGGGA